MFFVLLSTINILQCVGGYDASLALSFHPISKQKHVLLFVDLFSSYLVFKRMSVFGMLGYRCTCTAKQGKDKELCIRENPPDFYCLVFNVLNFFLP